MDETDRHLLAAHVTWMRLSGMSENTVRDRCKLLTRVSDALPFGLAYCHEDELLNWWTASARRGNWGRQTLVTYRRHIAGLYRWAVDYGHLSSDPSTVIPRATPPHRVPRPVPDDVRDLILTEARDPYRTWALLAAYCGLRCLEVSRLDRQDIDETGIWLHGKGDRAGWVPMHPRVWAAVEDLPAGPIATRVDGRRCTPENVSANFKIYVQRTFKVHAPLHRFRHSCATRLLRETGNMVIAQKVMRHRSIATTAGYTAVADEELAAAVAALA